MDSRALFRLIELTNEILAKYSPPIIHQLELPFK